MVFNILARAGRLKLKTVESKAEAQLGDGS